MLQGLEGLLNHQGEAHDFAILIPKLYNTETLEDVYIFLDLSKEKKTKITTFFSCFLYFYFPR